jgi:NADPH:quinone reductase-like Zn-dependent oxidoreductase
MQAIVQDRYGTADVLELQEVDRPTVAPDEVLVRVRAASVHIGDWHVMTGLPYLMRVLGFGLRAPSARVRGMDAAGIVEAVGSSVTAFAVGDEVYGTLKGAFAEYATARVGTLARKPANLSFEEAAAVPTSGVTALRAVRTAEVAPGQRVLVIGASGGIGVFAVQIVKAAGAVVTGVCSTGKVEMVRALGADEVVDYTRDDVARLDERYDAILDMVGTHSLTALRRLLRPRGTLVPVGGEGGGRVIGAVGRTARAAALSPFVSQRLRPMMALANAADLETLREMIEAGAVRPVVERTYRLAETPEAMRRLSVGGAQGKLVITL